MPSPRLVSLQYVRAAAALSVLFIHVSMNVAALTGFSTPFQFFNWNFGFYGVSAFFVLSGYLMSSLVAEGTAPAPFLAHRLLRIYPTYWLAAGIVLAIRAAAGSPLPLTSLLLLIPVPNPPAFLLAPLGGVEWSLVYEVFFYLLSAAFCFAPLRRWHAPALLAWLVALLTLNWLSPYLTHQNVLHFHYRLLTANWHLPFVAGGLGYYLLRVLRPNAFWCLGGIALFLISWSQDEIGHARLTPFAFTAILLYIVHRNKEQTAINQSRWPYRLGQRLGDYSYGIYLIHYPVAQWVAERLKSPNASWPAWFTAVGCSLAAGCLLGAVDVALYKRLRRWADRLFPAQRQQQRFEVAANRTPLALWPSVVLGLGLSILAVSLTLAVRSYTPVPVWDQWQFALDLVRYDGHYPVAALWTQQLEHRLPLLRLLCLTDTTWFSSQNLLLYVCLFAGHLGTAGLLIGLAWRYAGWHGSSLTVWAGLVLLFLFSPAQQENFTWPWQVCFITVVLSAAGAVAALLIHATESRSTGRQHWTGALAATAVLGAMAWLSAAPGLAVAALLAMLAWWLRLSWNHVLLLSGAALGGACAYLWNYHLPTIAPLDRLLLFGLKYISSGGPLLLSLAGLALWVWMIWHSVRIRRDGNPALFPAGMLFLATFALIIAPVAALSQASRTSFEPMDYGYTSISPLLWLGLAGYGLYYGQQHIRASREIAVGAMALALYPLVHTSDLLREEQWRETQRSRALVSIASSVRETDLSGLLLPRTGDWWPWRRFVANRHWSLFAEPLFRLQEQSISTLPTAPTGKDSLPVCLGAIDVGTVRSLTAPPPGIFITGWAWDQYRQQPVGTLLITDDQNRIVGYARTSVRRGDVTAAFSEIPDQRVGWQGYVPVALLGNKVHVLAEDGRSLTCRLEPELVLGPAHAP